jgi:eukaryotic-like serine/threonine-protein kinase
MSLSEVYRDRYYSSGYVYVAWRAERAASAADVYALGVMAFEMLSGRRPFPGPGFEDYREQHLHAEPECVSTRHAAACARSGS